MNPIAHLQKSTVYLQLICFCVISSWFNAEGQTCYTLGPQDRIRIQVFWHQDLCIDAEVAADGTIIYPLLGQVSVKGLCEKELGNNIKNALEKDYLNSAEVVVSIIEKCSKSVIVLGQVVRPGKIILTGESRLLDIISMAGGLSSQLIEKIIVLRTVENFHTTDSKINDRKKYDVHIVNYSDLFKDANVSLNIPVIDGDLVNVIDPSAGKFYIMGEVRDPGAYNVIEGLTLIKAITFAGGATKLASLRSVRIKRISGNGQNEVKASLNDPVYVDDVIVVPESLF